MFFFPFITLFSSQIVFYWSSIDWFIPENNRLTGRVVDGVTCWWTNVLNFSKNYLKKIILIVLLVVSSIRLAHVIETARRCMVVFKTNNHFLSKVTDLWLIHWWRALFSNFIHLFLWWICYSFGTRPDPSTVFWTHVAEIMHKLVRFSVKNLNQ